MTYNNTDIHLIYAGGTFGCHGTPLSPVSSDKFLPFLGDLLTKEALPSHHILPNDLVKDSSTLTPSDFLHFYQIITDAYNGGARKFVIITGTDTLSFLAAFLSNAFAKHDISIAVTGSMEPLLHSDKLPFELNKSSDAWKNLTDAIHTAKQKTGVFVQFYGKTFLGFNTQKINSQNHDAFDGIIAINKSHKNPSVLDFQAIAQKPKLAISSIFVLPNDAKNLEYQLTHLDKDVFAVILIAFGAGNLICNDKIKLALDDLHRKNIPVVCTSMCPYGGINSIYSAGSWQYAHHVWSGENLTIAGIYGRLLWLQVSNQLDLETWQQLSAYHEQ